ncbi:uncharacterized protein AMSG_06985 [Thecamonas trahens ATCC 50062]|uniref:Conserved oligomeric Golgi complex subunit 6 n=1 Tax=Thecamonas trahens ATCC 50062 TaxID=461836 RepID=A0A0L0DFR9_THETB|nr:hypothetical protein AMSG_06985 [Thecamonas trahens ATCC 50062]KNC51011.1 hypothetical protein AMSG_06985 [Thecamonas trahens ATCC 50062]|eukprot:XP_013756479.1 hypothetical protein AMSG_06985 [Thecamonas trahens ATCC 50062]
MSDTSALSSRLAGVLALDLDAPALAATLTAYTPTSPTTTTATPATTTTTGLPLAEALRSQLESAGLDSLRSFLAAHAPLEEELDGLDAAIRALHARTAATQARYQAAVGETSGLVARAGSLQAQAAIEADKATIVLAFLAAYQLTPDEEAALKAPALSEAFFAALDRVRAIKAACHDELRPAPSQLAGLEIMDQMAVLENEAYERLYRWVQSEGRSLDKDVAEIPDLLRKAVVALKLRPELFQCCLQEVASARHTAVVRGFLDAITRGGPSGMPRPIEVHAHDPLRYVGDLLAWLHQAVAWEKELVSVLFAGAPAPAPAPASATGSPPRAAPDADFLESPQALLAHIFQGVCRTFQVRFEQSLAQLGAGSAAPGSAAAGSTAAARAAARSSPKSLSTLFSLSNLLQFYTVTLGAFLGEFAPLVECIGVCRGRAEALFQQQLKGLADALVHRPPSVPSSLRPPPVLDTTVAQLSEVMLTFSGSLVPEDERESQFAPILDLVLHPLIKASTLSAVALQPADMAVYMLNCLGLMHAALAKYASFTAPALELVTGQMDAHLHTLVEEQAQSILSGCGVLSKLAVAQEHNPTTAGPLSRVDGMARDDMAAVMRAFDALLSATSVLVMPEAERLVDPTARQNVRSQVAEFIADAYARIYDAVCDARNGYGNPASILLHSPDEIKILLR